MSTGTVTARAAVELGGRLLETILVDCPDADICSRKPTNVRQRRSRSLRSARYDRRTSGEIELVTLFDGIRMIPASKFDLILSLGLRAARPCALRLCWRFSGLYASPRRTFFGVDQRFAGVRPTFRRSLRLAIDAPSARATCPDHVFRDRRVDRHRREAAIGAGDDARAIAAHHVDEQLDPVGDHFGMLADEFVVTSIAPGIRIMPRSSNIFFSVFANRADDAGWRRRR